MAQTYTPLQQGQAPVFGTSGSAVLELQKQLNAKGAGGTGGRGEVRVTTYF